MRAATIQVFGMANDTDKWAVLVDRYYGLFDTQANAEAVYATVGGTEGNDGLANTVFGAAQIMPPGYTPHLGEWGPAKPLSQYRPIDIADYITKRQIRTRRNYIPVCTTTADRLAVAKFWRGIGIGKED